MNPSNTNRLVYNLTKLMENDFLAEQLKLLEEKIKDSESLLLDPDMADLAKEEIDKLKQEKEALEMAMTEPQVSNSTPSKSTNSLDRRNAILEIKGAAGGDESKLFANELLRMYQRFAQIKGFRTELLDEYAIKIIGRGAFGLFKYEAGVHRVQRVPETEKKGRVHTSTSVVSVLPELEDIDLHIRDDDVQFEAFRSGGHGGQNVNKVSTAVRLKHIPSGIIVTCQTERHQAQNRENAMKMLRAKLWEREIEKRNEMISELRTTQVGRGMRAEKIRTYNFPQDRLTDHRINTSYHNLPVILDGGLEKIINDLKSAEQNAQA